MENYKLQKMNNCIIMKELKNKFNKYLILKIGKQKKKYIKIGYGF